MKKTIAIILILSISLLFLTGCGLGSTETTQQVQDTQPSQPQPTQQEESDEISQPPAFPED